MVKKGIGLVLAIITMFSSPMELFAVEMLDTSIITESAEELRTEIEKESEVIDVKEFEISPVEVEIKNEMVLQESTSSIRPLFAGNKALTSTEIVNYFNSTVGNSVPEASCLAFIANGFQALGATRSSACCAYKYGSSHIVSTSMDNIPVGADVFLNWSSDYKYTKYICPDCGQYCHHIAVYVGDGYIVHTSNKKVIKNKLSDVINNWDMDFRGWGYHGNVSITGFKGCLDSCTGDVGAINVRGWAFDQSDKGKSIDVHVYIGGQAGDINAECHAITANVSRPDVNDAYPGVGNNHGFNARIETAKTGRQSVYIYMINPSTGKNDFLASSSVNITEITPTSVSLNKSSVTLTSKGATAALKATVSPSNAVNKSVTWKSSNTSVATVNSSGVVTAVGNGTATITATTASGGKTATCKVTVSIQTSDGWNYVSSLPSGVSTSTHEIQYKHVYEKYAASSPGSGWTDTGVDKTEYVKSGSTYESQLPLTTSNTVRLSKYYYYHFCSGSKGNNANFAQNSTYGHWDQIKDTSSVYEHASYTDTDDSRYKYYYLKWSDGSDAYCNTSRGTCDGAYGSHGNRSYYWYKMYVYQNYKANVLNKYSYTSGWETAKDSSATSISYRYRAKPTGVSLNKTSATLTSKGATVTLTATVSPSNAANKSVTWKSSNTAVATVNSSGVVTAVGNGTATITVTTASGGKTATCKVTVNCPAPITKYTITYVLDGGTNSSQNPANYTKDTATITLKNPIRKGYTFKGWYSDSEKTTKVTEIKKGSTGDKKFYAKWSVNKYTIAFNGNSSNSGKMSSLTSRSYGKSYTLTANAYKKTGYTFTGWNTKADGSGTTYKNQASVKNLSSTNGGKVTLYAQWKKTKYTVAYELNGGTNNKSNPASYYVTTSTKKLQNPTRKGYTFKGWYSDSKYNNKVTQIKTGSTGNKKFYAKWSANKYTIAFNGNGSNSGKMSSLTSRSYGKTYTLTANTFKKTGYTFTGWNTKKDGSGTTYKNKASVKNLSSTNGGKVTLYAQWKKVKYTVTYKLNGGTNSKDNPSSYYVTTSTKTLKNPTRSGYTFKGWYKESTFKTRVKTIEKGSTGNLTLYAKWVKK